MLLGVMSVRSMFSLMQCGTNCCRSLAFEAVLLLPLLLCVGVY